MKRQTSRLSTRRLRSNQQRKTMLKKLHQKVMQRRKLFQVSEIDEPFSEAC